MRHPTLPHPAVCAARRVATALCALSLSLSAAAACAERDVPAPTTPTDDDDDAFVFDWDTFAPEDAGAAVPTGPARTLTVATWNVRFLFDPSCDTGFCGPDDWEQTPSASDYASQLDGLAAGLELIDADIVLLQEIETATALTDLHARVGDRFGVQVLGEVGIDGSLDVAVLSRGELVDTRGYRQIPIAAPDGSTTQFTRELLQVELEIDGAAVVVLVAHFKSKSQDDENQRLAEAEAAGRIARDVADARPDALVVFGGDLNDTPGSPTLEVLEEGGGLARAGALMDPGEDWTYAFFGSPQAIDHLYLGEASAGALVEGGVSVVRKGPESLLPSDHAALRATFTVPTRGGE